MMKLQPLSRLRAPIEVSDQVQFAHPRAAVFALFSDPRQRPLWQHSLTHIELLDSGEPRLGMRWRERPQGLFTFELEITAYEPSQHWAERFTSALGTGGIELWFREAGPRVTLLDICATLELKLPLRIGAPIAQRLLGREMRRDMRLASDVLSSRPAIEPA